ncbi:gliding motility-associated C-terminal domain-containing protein [Panacibacter ginsenosidivorans]|uniref:gliding motility-associated C-terminal domain-containing protein n=1 Tax=Panacibacter ginsenosidivorans TaxID=1813871 RepID=UPI001315718A|nr:gliding motility-associated C-terminal domain-containing protein [Panacibacter ginsenosidivorans]
MCLLLSYNSNAQEICNNGIDDDGDKLTDLQDPDCQCHFTVTGNLLQNASFELYDHCPVNYLYTTDNNIADYWRFGSYTNINEAYFFHNFQCQYDSQQIMLYMPPARPLPDGNGFISIYKGAYINPAKPENEMVKGYVGQCLEAPLTVGESYTLSFYAGRFRSWDNYTGVIYPFTVAVFGNADCNAVPFGKPFVSGNGCPSNYPGWILLGNTTMYSNGQWVQGKVNLTIPSAINVIEIGSDCSVLKPIIDLTDSTTFLDYHQYYLDDLHLLPTKDFPFEYIHVKAGSSCTDHPILIAPVYENASYQWYKDSIAIKGATDSIYNVIIDTGKSYYNVTINTSYKCIISEPFLITASKLSEIKIPADTIFCTENNSIILSPAFDGITYNINGLISSVVNITKEGSYTIVASDATGCQKTFNANVRKTNCSGCEAHMPTAFTPNGDGMNDLFRPRFNCNVSAFEFMIFNKWGQKIFETKDVNKGWDGTYKGNKLSPDAYVYFMQYSIISGVRKATKGSVVLIR